MGQHGHNKRLMVTHKLARPVPHRQRAVPPRLERPRCALPLRKAGARPTAFPGLPTDLPMPHPIYVINPNSDTGVTAGLDAAVAPLRLAGGPPIECVTLADGPPGV